MSEARLHGHFRSEGPIYEPSQAAKACDPSSWEAELGRWVRGQLELLQSKFEAELGNPGRLNHQAIRRCHI